MRKERFGPEAASAEGGLRTGAASAEGLARSGLGAEVRFGHNVGCPDLPPDPRDVVGRDGLTAHQRAYVKRGLEAPRPPKTVRWTRKSFMRDGKLVTITREEMQARREGASAPGSPRAPAAHVFEPAWYPNLCPGGRYVQTAAELRSLLRRFNRVQE